MKPKPVGSFKQSVIFILQKYRAFSYMPFKRIQSFKGSADTSIITAMLISSEAK